MNLKELKARIDKLCEYYGKDLERCTVYITTSEPSIGGRAKCGVKSVALGFDWENNQLRIDPEEKLIKWNKPKHLEDN